MHKLVEWRHITHYLSAGFLEDEITKFPLVSSVVSMNPTIQGSAFIQLWLYASYMPSYKTSAEWVALFSSLHMPGCR